MTTAREAAEGLEEIAQALRNDADAHPLVRWSLMLSFWNPAWETSTPDRCLRGISYNNTPSAAYFAAPPAATPSPPG